MAGLRTGKGVNVQRKLFSGETNYDDEIADIVTAQAPRFIFRAVVVDVIFDPSIVIKQLSENISTELARPELLATAPRNSIIARVVTDASDRRTPTLSIFYPTLSHTHEPVKPGEQVWVFYEDPLRPDIGFWLSRIVEPLDIDDPNFTHGDRKFIDQRAPTTFERLEKVKQLEGLSSDAQARLKAASDAGPRFPNGGDTDETYSVGTPDGYELIEETAIANAVITKEPVPRYSKRPSDWAAEGSNNSLLVLGEDRTSATAIVAGGKVDSKPEADKPTFAGMFDIVAGRGIGIDRRIPSPDEPGSATSPNVIQNARKVLETDKDISKQKQNEGDPDFEFDAARIYGAMDTNVDGNFGKELPNLNNGAKPEKVESGSAIVVKSNNVRIIAREDGTVRIVKEGVIDDEGGKGHAVIMIEKDGTIMIDGPHIIIGSGIEKGNGEGTQVYIGRDAEEPIVMGNILKSVLTDYTTQMKTAIDTFVQELTKLGVKVAAPPGLLGNLGLPLAGMTEIGITLGAAPAALQGSVDSATSKFQNDLTTILSKVGKTK